MHGAGSDGGGADWSYGGLPSGSGQLPAPDGPPPAPLRLPRPGERFGPFEVGALLGRGGMGAVFRARDPAVGRDVALKVILGELDPARRARFRREGEVTAQLKHPGIVGVHSAGEAGGVAYLAYELVEDARSLLVAFDGLAPRGRVELVRDAARALGHAHARGLVHRDVKPENVLVDGAGRVRVADFGLAAGCDLERLTQTGALVGTPTHMAPEQFLAVRDAPPGPPADVWALGVLLYQALTGELPFEGATLLELGARIAEGEPIPPRRLAPEVSLDLEAVCLTALAKAPAHRYRDAGALADDLDRVLAGAAPHSAAAASRTVRGLRAGKRAGLTIGALLALAALLLLASWALRGDPAAARELRWRELEQGLEQALASARPLSEDAAEVERLRGLLGELQDAQPDPGRVLRARRRVAFLVGLSALSEGDRPQAERQLPHLSAPLAAPPPPLDLSLAGALESALLAGSLDAQPASAEVDPIAAAQAVRALGEAIDAGLRRPELRAARALCLLASTRGAERVAMGLGDLAAVARVRPLRPAEREARVRLHLRAGELSEARAALSALPGPSRELELALVLAEVRLLLDEARTIAAEERLREYLRAAAPLPVAPERRALAARARDLAERRVALLERGADVSTILAALQLSRLLDPEAPIARPLVEPLVGYAVAHKTKDHELAAAVAALVPEDLEVQVAIAQRMQGLEDPKPLAVLEPSLRRAVALAGPDDPRALGLRMLEVEVAAVTGDDELALALSDRLLPALEDGDLIGLVHVTRSNVYARRGDPARGLAELDAALASLRLIEPKLWLGRAGLLERLGRREEALRDALRFALEGNPDSLKFEWSQRMCWELGRALGRHDEPLRATARLVRRRPHLGGWRARRAWLLLAAGDRPAAQAALAAAAQHLAGDPLDAARRLAAPTREAAAALEQGHPAAAQAALDEVLERLEALRLQGEGFTP